MIRPQRLVPFVSKSMRNRVDVRREHCEIHEMFSRIYSPNSKERPIVEPSVAIAGVDKALYLLWRERPLDAKTPVSEKSHNKRFGDHKLFPFLVALRGLLRAAI
jgi:hypothetical protein